VEYDVGDADEAPPHLREYLSVLYKHRRLALTVFAATVLLALLASLLTPRRYTASTQLQVSRQSPIELQLPDNVRRLDDGDRPQTGDVVFVATQVAALQSRDLAERVIRTWRLADNETFLHPRSGSPPPSPGMLRDSVRPRRWAADDVAPPTEPQSAPPVDSRLIDRYMKWLSVSDVRGTDLIEVRFTTGSPALSAFLAAAHTDAFVQESEDARRATDTLANDFLEEQLDHARQQVEGSQATLAAFAAQHPNVAVNEEQKVIAAHITDLSAVLTKAEAARATLESRYEFLTHPESNPLAYFLERTGIQRLRLSLLDARAERAAVGQRLGPNHPRMLQLAQYESELQRQLKTEVTQAVTEVKNQFAAAKKREERLRKTLRDVERKGVDSRALGAQYDALRHDVEAARTLRESLLRKRNETAVNSQLAGSKVRVVERADVPLRPSRPKMLLDLTLGVLTALLLGIAAPFAREYFDAGVKGSQDVERLLSVPTLAIIPKFTLPQVAGAAAQLPPPEAGDGDVNGASTAVPAEVVVEADPWSHVAEAFRQLRTALLCSGAGPCPNIIAVTSAGPGEGKTLASLNLAGALAETGARVLLIDADLRHPRCHRTLGVANDRGLANHLADPAGIGAETLVHAIASPPIFFVPAGLATANPAKLVTAPRLSEFLAQVRSQYDYIIVDTPPVLPVADAVMIARAVDGVVLVVKGNHTPRDIVRRARDRLALAGARVLGVIVNDVAPGWDSTSFYDPYARYVLQGRAWEANEEIGSAAT
jgi:capsular exopolysaccharide synthesis family protein